MSNNRVLLATIRDKGLCPCPRCLTPKSQMDLMGLVRDMTARVTKVRKFLARLVNSARELIYKKAVPIGGAAIEGLLKSTSSVPTVVRFKSYALELFSMMFRLRMHLLTDLGMILIYLKCSS